MAWLAVAMAVQFYTFNEAFAEMTAVWTGALVAGFAVAGRSARRKVARLAGLADAGLRGFACCSPPRT